MALDTFPQVFLPYCIRWNRADGTWSVLNREYEDLGTDQPGPIGANGKHYAFQGLTDHALQAIALRHHGDKHEWFYFLYDGDEGVDFSKEAWRDYTERLWKLRELILLKAKLRD